MEWASNGSSRIDASAVTLECLDWQRRTAVVSHDHRSPLHQLSASVDCAIDAAGLLLPEVWGKLIVFENAQVVPAGK